MPWHREECLMSTLQDLRAIPQPQPKFVLGNMIDVGPAMQFQHLIELAKEYGPIYQITLPTETMIVLSSQSLVNEVCDDARFDKYLPPVQRKLRDLAGDGLFTAWTSEPNWGK